MNLAPMNFGSESVARVNFGSSVVHHRFRATFELKGADDLADDRCDHFEVDGDRHDEHVVHRAAELRGLPAHTSLGVGVGDAVKPVDDPSPRLRDRVVSSNARAWTEPCRRHHGPPRPASC